jgi:hypothetical protein
MGDRPPRPTLSSRPLNEMMWPCTPPKGNFIRKLRFKLQVLYVKRDTHFRTTTASFARERARSHRHDVIHDPSHPPHTARHIVTWCAAPFGGDTHTHTQAEPHHQARPHSQMYPLSLSLEISEPAVVRAQAFTKRVRPTQRRGFRAPASSRRSRQSPPKKRACRTSSAPPRYLSA